MSVPENPLRACGGACSMVSACSVIASNATRESARTQGALRIKGILHFPHQRKIGARRSPWIAGRALYLGRAPFQHDLSARLRVRVELKHVFRELPRGLSRSTGFAWRQESRVENSARATKRREREPFRVRELAELFESRGNCCRQ